METKAAGWQRTLCYVVAWLASILLIFADLMAIRYVLLDLMAWMAISGWTIEFVDRGMLLVLGCIGLALAVAFEYYFREGSVRRLLLRRVVKVLGIELAVFVVGMAAQAAILALA